MNGRIEDRLWQIVTDELLIGKSRPIKKLSRQQIDSCNDHNSPQDGAVDVGGSAGSSQASHSDLWKQKKNKFNGKCLIGPWIVEWTSVGGKK